MKDDDPRHEVWMRKVLKMLSLRKLMKQRESLSDSRRWRTFLVIRRQLGRIDRQLSGVPWGHCSLIDRCSGDVMPLTTNLCRVAPLIAPWSAILGKGYMAPGCVTLIFSSGSLNIPLLVANSVFIKKSASYRSVCVCTKSVFSVMFWCFLFMINIEHQSSRWWEFGSNLDNLDFV